MPNKHLIGPLKRSPGYFNFFFFFYFLLNHLNCVGGVNVFFFAVNEVAERLAFFAIAVNMVSYLVLEMHETVPTAATHVTDWIGAAYVLTLLGAYLADSYLGRFKTIIIFSCIYAVVRSSLGKTLFAISISIV